MREKSRISLFVSLLAFAGLLAGPVPGSAKSIVVKTASSLSKVAPEPGDTVVFRNGTYSNATLKIPFSGTEKSRITVMAETPGGVRCEGRSYLKISGSHLNVEGFVFHNPSLENSYVIFLNKGTADVHLRECCVWADEDAERSPKIRTKWLCSFGTRNEIERCSFDGKCNIGLMVDVCFGESGAAPETVVHNCFFSRPYSLLNSHGYAMNGQESFRFGSSKDSMSDAKGICRDNWFYRCNGEIETISSKSSGNLYENNLFENCRGELTLRHGNRNVVRGNIFLSDGDPLSGGVRIIGEGHLVEDNYMQGLGGSGFFAAICVVGSNPDPELYEYWPADNSIIRRNTVVDCCEGIKINHENHCGGPIPPKNLRVEKNVFSLSPGALSVFVNKMDPSEIRWKKNVIFGGTQKGSSFPETSVAPKLPDVSGRAESIRKGAGVSYDYKKQPK